MISNNFYRLPKDIIEKFIEGNASEEESDAVTDSIMCDADLWTLRLIKKTSEKCKNGVTFQKTRHK